MINDTTTTTDPISTTSFTVSVTAFTLKTIVSTRDITALFNNKVYKIGTVTLSSGYPDRLSLYTARLLSARNELSNKRSYIMAKTNVFVPTKYVYQK